MSKIITSIDIGSKNLGMCVLQEGIKNTDDNNSFDGSDEYVYPKILFMDNINLCDNQIIKPKKTTTTGKPSSSNKPSSSLKKKQKLPTVDLKLISHNLHNHLNNPLFLNSTDIIIEKQYTPGNNGGQNNRMNSISYMIYQYFVDESRHRREKNESSICPNIVFVQPSARFKLKVLPKSIETIDTSRLKIKKNRKKYSVELTLLYLQDMNENEYLEILQNDSKADDKADTFLSALEYLQRDLFKKKGKKRINNK